MIERHRPFKRFFALLVLSALATTLACSRSKEPLTATSAALTQASPKAQAYSMRIFDRVAGRPLPANDPRAVKMGILIDQGKVAEAAMVAMDDDGFYDVTLKHLFAPMSNRDESHLFTNVTGIQGDDSNTVLNDFIATAIGAVHDNLDARELLTGNMVYRLKQSEVDKFNRPANAASGCNVDIKEGDPNYLGCRVVWSQSTYMYSNDHYKAIEGLIGKGLTHLKGNLVREPQRVRNSSNNVIPLPDYAAAGLLTTRTFTRAHLYMGTNRRAIQFAFREFLCQDVKDMRDTTLDDENVRRDVTRAPGGKPSDYQLICRGCHSGMDSLSGTFARYNFSNVSGASTDTQGFRLRYGPFETQIDQPNNSDSFDRNGVVYKSNHHESVYPGGHVVVDDAWENRWTQNQNAALGWRTAVKGHGVNDFGIMLANSKAFGQCMARRAIREFCRIDAVYKGSPWREDADINASVERIGEIFEANQYNLKRLFAEVAAAPYCIPRN